MSIFGRIASAIFGSSKATPAASDTPTGATGGGGAAGSAGAVGGASGSVGGMAGASAATGGRSPAPMAAADVEAMIAQVAARRSGQFNWQESIVDLMKLLDLDSSLAARKELAQELGYTGALDGSAEMNIWLHRQVMAQLAATGGQVPDRMRH